MINQCEFPSHIYLDKANKKSNRISLKTAKKPTTVRHDIAKTEGI